jgi:lipid-A-disaccharide synthase-like uncharacterized protein
MKLALIYDVFKVLVLTIKLLLLFYHIFHQDPILVIYKSSVNFLLSLTIYNNTINKKEKK